MDERRQKNGVLYEYILNSEQKSPYRRKIRKIVDDFDKAVNPFINDEKTLDDISNYSSKVTIGGEIYKSRHGREGNCKMIIKSVKDKSDKRCTVYERNDSGFRFELHYSMGKSKYLIVSHYYATDNDSREENIGEWVDIYYREGKGDITDVSFGLSSGYFKDEHGDKNIATYEQLALIYDGLVKATELVSSITIKNMEKKKKTRKLQYKNEKE